MKIENTLRSKENLPPYLEQIFSELRKQIIFNDARGSRIKLISMKFYFSECIRQIDLRVRKRFSFRSCSAKIMRRFDERIRVLTSFVMDFEDCEQQRDDISIELSFLKLMADAIVEADARPMFAIGRRHLNSAFELAHFNGAATNEIRTRFSMHATEALNSRYLISADQKTLLIITSILILILLVIMPSFFA